MLECPHHTDGDWDRTHAKSINPRRQPPRVYLVGEGAPALEGTMVNYDWRHMNLELGSRWMGDEGWPAPAPRLGRRRIEIHEPARPFGIHVYLLPLSRHDADVEPPIPAHLISYLSAHPDRYRHITFLDGMRPEPFYAWESPGYYATLRWGNKLRRLFGCREVRFFESTRLYLEDLDDRAGMTSIELLPKRQAAVEYVMMRAQWQERLVPKSEAQVGVPDTPHVEEAFEEGDWHDARVDAEWLFAFDNR